ncbi:MAG: type 2 isopentenyl-diphosphate Delta-isomerase [Rhizobiaceae bacterium]|nr:type 2 isopentenyl-diphosphate Delta-isomerase [Rhizobiaceae bacterium]
MIRTAGDPTALTGSEATADIGERKTDHLDIVLAPKLASKRVDAGFDAIRFEHCALPELDVSDIDLSATFVGRRLRAPLLISSMTGGPERSARINAHLAEAAQELRIALGVGSQRIALEGRAQGGLDGSLRRLAPDIALLANIGAAQLVLGYGLEEARRAVDMIEADALIVHLNPLQEAVQAGGDRSWRGVLDAIETLVRELGCPIVVKEVGAGLSANVARRLMEAGVSVIDVAGAGGTSWSAVEAERAASAATRETALLFADWGIPTATAIRAVRKALPEICLVGSGGVRSGLDAAKAIRLGADLAGQAAAGLAGAEQSTEAVVAHFSTVAEQLRIACFCTGSANLAALRKAPLLQDGT